MWTAAGYHPQPQVTDGGVDVPPNVEASCDITRCSFMLYLMRKRSRTSIGIAMRRWRRWMGGVVHRHKIPTSSMTAP